MWGFRDALYGDELEVEKVNGYYKGKIKINRHHYRFSDPLIKIECFIEALVPLNDESHGQAHNADCEQFFTRAIDAMLMCDFDRLIEVLREKWKPKNLNDFKKWLEENHYHAFDE